MSAPFMEHRPPPPRSLPCEFRSVHVDVWATGLLAEGGVLLRWDGHKFVPVHGEVELRWPRGDI